MNSIKEELLKIYPLLREGHKFKEIKKNTSLTDIALRNYLNRLTRGEYAVLEKNNSKSRDERVYKLILNNIPKRIYINTVNDSLISYKQKYDNWKRKTHYAKKS
jgi:hypothetical protein